MLEHQSRGIEVAIEALLDQPFPDSQAGGSGIPAANVDRLRPSGEISALTGLKSVTWGRINVAHAIDITHIKTDAAGLLTLFHDYSHLRAATLPPASDIPPGPP